MSYLERLKNEFYYNTSFTFSNKKLSEAQDIAVQVYSFLNDAIDIIGGKPIHLHNPAIITHLLSWHAYDSYSVTAPFSKELLESVEHHFGFIPDNEGIGGAFRRIFVYNENYIIKYARCSKALFQNLLEADIFADNPEAFPEVYYVDPFGRFSIIENLSNGVGDSNLDEIIKNHKDLIKSSKSKEPSFNTIRNVMDYAYILKTKDAQRIASTKRSIIKLAASKNFYAVVDYLSNNTAYDLHSGNIGFRGEQLVITDAGGHYTTEYDVFDKSPHIKTSCLENEVLIKEAKNTPWN